RAAGLLYTFEETKPRPLSALEETRPLSALEAVGQQRRLVFTGDPGGGKTTFVNYLAHYLAAHIVEPQGGWLRALSHRSAAETDAKALMRALREYLGYDLTEPLDQPTAEMNILPALHDIEYNLRQRLR